MEKAILFTFCGCNWWLVGCIVKEFSECVVTGMLEFKRRVKDD
jgi:hypothetical protein